MPLDLTFNSGTPAAPFGTQEHFAFCENVPLECQFSYAEWQGPHDNQTEHLGHLLRHGVPLIWRNGAKHCTGLKIPKFSAKKSFVAEIKRLLRPVNLAEPDAPIKVKSARIGEVKNNFYSFEPCLAFSKTEFSCSKTQTMGIPLQVRFCNVLGFVSGFHAVCLKIWSCFPHCIL